MRLRSTGVVVGLLGLVLSGCSSEPPVSAADEARERIERMAGTAPADLVERVQQAYDATVMRVRVSPTAPEGQEATPYTLIAGPDAWRVDVPHPGPDAPGDGLTTALVIGDELCFDREFRSVVRANVAGSYGLIEFDREPWTCAASDFGVNRLATHRYPREDPRWRIEQLTTEPADDFVAEVAEVDGEPVLHVRTTGVTYDGPLDPERPAYDLWLDGDHLPVRMETEGIRWDFDYEDGLAEQLAPPARHQRGSYGWDMGPGHGWAKACYHASSECPKYEGELTWGDGRRS